MGGQEGKERQEEEGRGAPSTTWRPPPGGLADGLVGSSLATLVMEWNTSPLPEEQDDDISDCFAALLDGKKMLPMSSLSLRGDKITDKGARAIATALRTN